MSRPEGRKLTCSRARHTHTHTHFMQTKWTMSSWPYELCVAWEWPARGLGLTDAHIFCPYLLHRSGTASFLSIGSLAWTFSLIQYYFSQGNDQNSMQTVKNLLIQHYLFCVCFLQFSVCVCPDVCYQNISWTTMIIFTFQ